MYHVSLTEGGQLKGGVPQAPPFQFPDALFSSCTTGMIASRAARFCPRRGGSVPLAINGEAAAPLVWVSGVFMRASTIPIAIAIALIPLPALPFDQDEFCIAITDIVLRMNARKGRWLDRSTRHDGVELDCELKTLEAKRFVNADRGGMRQGWEERKEQEWSAAYCNDDAWREAIDNGWSIFSTLAFRTGEQVSFVAEC